MAGTRYAYVRDFERPDPVLPHTYMVVRIDGKGFHKFSDLHHFVKPNDAVALELMNCAARYVMQELKGSAILAFGESDEYSFLFKKECTLYNRRESKITTHVVSLFTGAYVLNWPRFFPKSPLRNPPSFDGRLIAYPGASEVRDYFSWRQADTHINSLYNTAFWSLVQHGGQTEREAHASLRGTVSAQKHELLFGQHGINYNDLPALFRKGTTIVWQLPPTTPADRLSRRDSHAAKPSEDSDKSVTQSAPGFLQRKRARLRTLHVDIIGSSFWEGAEATGVGQADLDESWEEEQQLESDEGNATPWMLPARLRGDSLGADLLK